MKPSLNALLVAAIALAVALGASIDLRLASAGARPTLQEVTEGVTCQCGCGLTVANCNHPDCSFSIPIKKNIAAMLERGMSTSQILALYRAKYGEKILSAPTAEGFNLLAWLTPFAVLLIGALGVVATIARWNRRALSKAPTAIVAPGEIDPQLRSRLQRELHDGL